MDLRADIHKEFQAEGRIDAANIVIQTDGGLRPDCAAAAAFIIGLWKDAAYSPLLCHSTFIISPCTAFQTEAIALDEASKAVEILLGQI